MIRDRTTYTRAVRELKGIQRRIEAGDRCPALLERYRAGSEYVIAYELTETPTASDHLALEAAYAFQKGAPLPDSAPVPGCPCELCTDVPDTPPRSRTEYREALDVEAARAVPIASVADRLGIEHAKGWALCPFHDDRTPSFHLNDTKQAAFCNPCGKSWDAIALTMDVRGLTFPDAVRELTR